MYLLFIHAAVAPTNDYDDERRCCYVLTERLLYYVRLDKPLLGRARAVEDHAGRERAIAQITRS